MIEATYDPVEGLIKLGLAAFLLAITIAISYIKRLQLSRELGIAAVRGFIQLIISFMFLAANILTTILATHLAERYLFTDAHQLISRGIEVAR